MREVSSRLDEASDAPVASSNSGWSLLTGLPQPTDVTVVGDTTAGASCNDRGGYSGDRRLQIRVRQTGDDLAQGRDRQPEFAFQLLN